MASVSPSVKWGRECTVVEAEKLGPLAYAQIALAFQPTTTPAGSLAPQSPHAPDPPPAMLTCSPTRHSRPVGDAPAAGPPTATVRPCFQFGLREAAHAHLLRVKRCSRLKTSLCGRFPLRTSGQERYASGCPVGRAVPHPVVRSEGNTSGSQCVPRVGEVLVVTTVSVLGAGSAAKKADHSCARMELT